MIKRIELINFMSHRHTVIEPADGLTVLVGPNNCGKSAFVTALQILCHNSASGFVLRHGEKKCEVIVETQDGHVIHWSRKKNGAGTYVVDGQPFDRLRGKVPEEVHQILKMPKVVCDKDEFDIHFGEQSDPVFLLKDRGKAAAQFFASSSDATHLVAMQHEHKSNVTVAKRDFKRLNTQQEVIQEQLNDLEPIEGIDKRLGEVEKIYEEIVQTDTSTRQLEFLADSIRKTDRRVFFATKLAAGLQPLVKPPELAEVKPLTDIVNRMRYLAEQHAVNGGLADSVKNLVAPPKLKDTLPLVRIIKDIRFVKIRFQSSEKLASQLAKMISPPVMEPVSELIALLSQIRRKARSKEWAAAAADVLADVQIAEAQTPLEPLQDLIQRLGTARQTLAMAQRQLESVESVSRPPTPIDTTPVSQLIEEIAAKQQAVDSREKKLTEVEQQLVAVRGEIEKWVLANPKCPTCGGTTDPNRLVDHSCQQQTSDKGERDG